MLQGEDPLPELTPETTTSRCSDLLGLGHMHRDA
jgi:hypothetical protein